MTGLGSLDYTGGGGGGAGLTSPTTSNLSPLAPPFTIDLPNHNNKSYGLDQESFAYLSYPSSSSSQGNNNNWLHLYPPTSSTTTLSESFTNPNLEIESLTGYIPSTSNTSTTNNNHNYSYGHHNKPYYFDSPSIDNLSVGGNTFVPIASPNATSVTTTATCNSFPHVQPSYKARLRPYEPRLGDRKSSPSVVIRKPDGSDIITISGVAVPSEMSKPVHYDAPNGSGLGYNTPTWGGFWNRAGEWEEKGSRKEHDGNFDWTEKVHTGSSTFKISPFKETPVADGWTAACGEVSGVSLGKTVEPLLGEYDINSPSAKFASSAAENARMPVSNMPSHSLFSSSAFFPEISEVPSPVEPYRGSSVKPWSQLSANHSSFNQSFSSLDDPKFYPSNAYYSVGPTSSAVGTISSAPNKSIKSGNFDPIERAGNKCCNSEDLRDYTPSSAYRKDLFIQLNVDRKESIADTRSLNDEMDRTNQTLMNSPTSRKDIISNGGPILHNSWNQLFTGEQENKFNFNDASSVKPVAASVAADSVESSSDMFDRLNPPVDSPCWKGAPAFRSFPFTDKEVLDAQIFPVNDGDDTAAVSQSENGNPIKENEQEANGNISSSFTGLPLEVRDRNGVRLSYGSEEPNKECFVASKAKEKVTIGRGLDDANPLGEGSNASASKQPVPKLDAGLLINSLHNLSELLLATCLNGASTLEEQDHEILQCITSNLNTCALMKPGTMRSQSTSSCSDRSLPDPRKGVAGGMSQVKTEEARALQNLRESQTVLKEWMSSTMCQGLVSQLGDTGFEKDNDMIQRIKKHLKDSRDVYDDDDDDDDDEVSLSRVQLYKNLWIEAEAAMCSMQYNARCASMKIEKEYRQQQEKGNKSINVEEHLSSKILGDQNSFEALSPTTKHKLSTKTTTQETSQTNTNNQVEDVEASVMARLNLLKCRVDHTSSMSTEGNRLQGLKDSSNTKTTSEEASKVSTNDQVNDIESSVMARLNILKCRVDNSSSMSATEGKQLQGIKDSLNTKTTAKEGSKTNTSDQVNDSEASVMASLNILKCRVDNSSCMSTEGSQPQGSTKDGANTETAKKTHSQGGVSGTNVEIKARPFQLVDQGVTKRSKLWPFIVVDETEDEISNLQGIQDVPYVGGLCLPDESIIQSYLPDKFGRRVSVGSYDSASSEWEHVLKDELTWQN